MNSEVKQQQEMQTTNFSLEPKNTITHNVIMFFSAITLFVSLYLVFIWSPIEKTMGVVQKIFYFHVATAWNAAFAFFIVFVCSILFLITKKRIYDVYATVSAEIGVAFILIVLSTGPIWAKSAWNVWWAWEPRLTSSLILFFIYLAYIMIRQMDGSWDKKARLCAVFGIIGFADVPIVFMATKWWNTKFHPVVLGSQGGGLETPMLITMIFGFVTMTFFYFVLLQKGVRIEKASIELQRWKEKLAESFAK